MEHQHLERAELEAWRRDARGDRDRIVSAIAVCATCREVAALVERAAPAGEAARFDAASFVAAGYGAFDAREPGGRAWHVPRWALAAAAVLALAGVSLLMQRTAAPPSNVLRGGELVLDTPVGGIARVEEFRWRAGFTAATYVVDILDAQQRVIATRQTREPRLRVDSELQSRLVAGAYSWRVTARDAGGAVILTSGPQSFVVAR